MAGKDMMKKGTKERTAKVTKDKTVKPTKGKIKVTKEKEKETAFIWMDDKTQLLQKVTLNNKVSKAANGIDWELVCSKYTDIWRLMRTQLPTIPKTAEELGKDYPHCNDKVTKQVVTSKLKYCLAVDSGRSGHGRVVLLYFKLCKMIWGESPTTEQICSGVESADLEATTEQPDTDVNLSSTLPDEEEPYDTANISGGSAERYRVAQKGALFDKKLSDYRQENLK